MIRPPIVVVVGHVDHGKTSLLDYIRINCAKAVPGGGDEPRPIVGREAGGITQSIGAYEIAHNGKKITFIDTPGHEAFSKMRVRGASVADIAILVVAVDEGVKPQTEESICVLNESKTPFVVAITKIDKPNADENRVKNDLATHGVLLEGFGGNVSFHGISSKTGEGVNDLLDLILLASEMEDLSVNLSGIAKGIILESRMDSKKGIMANIILKSGKLKTGDLIATASAKGKVKVMENFLRERVKEIFPSDPAMVLGFETLPQSGEEFKAGKLSEEDLKMADEVHGRVAVKARKKEDLVIRIILKADVVGSLEALTELVKKIPLKPNERLEVISQAVGEISDGDVKDAMSTGAIILGFRTKTNKAAENLARIHGVTIINNEVIYKLIEEIEKAFLEVAEKPPSGELEILAVFSAKGKTQTIGGKVSRGLIRNKAWLEISRENQNIGKGKIVNLQCKKMDVGQVDEGKECGLVFESDVKIQAGDKLLAK